MNDNALKDVLTVHPMLHYVAAAAGAALVVGIGKLRQSRSQHATAA